MPPNNSCRWSTTSCASLQLCNWRVTGQARRSILRRWFTRPICGSSARGTSPATTIGATFLQPPPPRCATSASTRHGVLKAHEYPKQAEPPKGWIILDGGGDGELKGHEYPKQAEPPKGKGWVIELGGYKYHKQAEPPKRKELIIEFQWREAKPQIDPVEVQCSNDLPAFFKQFKVQMQVDAVEAFYVDDLRAYIKSPKQQKP